MEIKQLKLLAVDDNADNLTVLRAVIKEVFPEAEIFTALNGRKCIELAKSEDPDVIILDIVMPGMDGYEVCRILKADKLTSVIPVIFLTALSNSREVRAKALEAGAEAFLCKPFDETDLLAQIQTMTKIKRANMLQENEKERLKALVEEQTIEIKQELNIRRKAENELLLVNKRLKESEELLKSVVENSRDAFYRRSVETGQYDYMSPGILDVAGYTDKEMMAMPYESMMGRVYPDDLPALLDVIKNGVASGNTAFETEFRFLDNNGQFRWLVDRGNLAKDNTGKPVYLFGTIQDITERKKAQEDILYLSYHDQLTGLNNRRYFEDSLSGMSNEEYFPITVMIADINGLKLTNDAFGHEVGDKILQEVAKTIKRECRAKDIVARMGGGEFVLLLPLTDARNADAVILRLNNAIADVLIEGIVPSVSIGYSVKYDDTVNIYDSLVKAEDEMFRHKLYESTSMRSKTIDIIMNTLYEKSNREMLHSKRVGEFCEAISTKMSLNPEFIRQIKLTGLLHDIGKIGVDERILNSPGRLTDEEWIEIKKHSETGFRILSSVKEFSQVAEYVLEHHERWDGKGYPNGLKGEEISLQARIIAIADSYDAMTGYRTYRKSLSKAEAVDEIKKCSGTQFDPEVARVFVENVIGKI